MIPSPFGSRGHFCSDRNHFCMVCERCFLSKVSYCSIEQPRKYQSVLPNNPTKTLESTNHQPKRWQNAQMFLMFASIFQIPFPYMWIEIQLLVAFISFFLIGFARRTITDASQNSPRIITVRITSPLALWTHYFFTSVVVSEPSGNRSHTTPVKSMLCSADFNSLKDRFQSCSITTSVLPSCPCIDLTSPILSYIATDGVSLSQVRATLPLSKMTPCAIRPVPLIPFSSSILCK